MTSYTVSQPAQQNCSSSCSWIRPRGTSSPQWEQLILPRPGEDGGDGGDGGPGPEAKFIYDQGALFFGTDPIAMDLVCHGLLVAKRKEMGVKVNEHPRMTEYLRYAQKMGLGIADPAKITHVKA